jgi:hypothetical protein
VSAGIAGSAQNQLAPLLEEVESLSKKIHACDEQKQRLEFVISKSFFSRLVIPVCFGRLPHNDVALTTRNSTSANPAKPFFLAIHLKLDISTGNLLNWISPDVFIAAT